MPDDPHLYLDRLGLGTYSLVAAPDAVGDMVGVADYQIDIAYCSAV